MNIKRTAYLLFLGLAVPLTSHAGDPPACPNNTIFWDFMRLDSPPNPPVSNVDTGFRAANQLPFGLFQYLPVNIVISGSNITFDVNPAVLSDPSVFPISIGRLPAGSYTAVIRPVVDFTNPPFVCPTETLTFQVQGAYEYVPVPLRGPAILVGLLLLAGGIALVPIRKRT